MRKILVTLVTAGVLTGCGAAPAAAPAPTPAPPVAATASAPTSAPTITAQPIVLPTPTSLPAVTVVATPPPLGTGASLEDQARAALATHLKVAENTLTLVSSETVDWPNGALGCPAADQAYAQVIVPGYRMVFSDGSKTYAVHTSENGRPMIFCDTSGPQSLPPTTS